MFSALHCPHCRVLVSHHAEELACESCGRRYPIVCGIPDLRVAPDPYIGLEEDREKARRLFEEAKRTDFEGLVRFYFRITPEVPDEMAARYVEWVGRLAEPRCNAALQAFEREIEGRIPRGRTLEIGCGSGPALRALSARDQVVGVDVALRWLVIAKKRLESDGTTASLVCACAEALPFAPNSFDRVISLASLEHFRDPRAALSESRRVLDRDGASFVTTPNPWRIGPDPYFGVWGLSALPARLRESLARGLKGLPFDQVRAIDHFALRTLALDAGYRRAQSLAPEAPTSELSGAMRAAGWLYDRLPSEGALALPRLLLGPDLRLVAYKGPNRS
jgi:SAM-dependent methyltransferase